MQILVFSRDDRDCIHDLVAAVGDTATVIRVQDESKCKTALTRCLDGETILIFFISDGDDMAFLEDQARQFIDMKLIIYLDAPDLSARSYQLKPRLVIDSRDSPALLPGAVKGILGGLLSYKNKLSI